LFQSGLKERIKAAVVCPVLSARLSAEEIRSRLEEAVGLALAIDLDVVFRDSCLIRQLRPATFFSGGFLEKLQPVIDSDEVSLLVVDAALSPIQQRNLERALKIKVIDRTALILEIFGERAKTKEGKLQVELAHLTYQRSRLVRSWTHLERQRGGAGFLGGPGEKQIELDRRLIDDKIVRIRKDLEKVRRTRALQRGNRQRVPYPVVALVGYTNAGKSSLFNRLAGSDVLAEDMLFATLDPTLRKIRLPSGCEVILSDTVGFISDLPHELVMAFRATLEEVESADLLLHVRDIANPNNKTQKQEVLNVLQKLIPDESDLRARYVEVLNKTDLLSESESASVAERVARAPDSTAAVSAVSGQGCRMLLELIDRHLSESAATCEIDVPVERGDVLAWLYDHAVVKKVGSEDDRLRVFCRLSEENRDKLWARFGIRPC
jgi:GTP-binding protein HflX